MKAIVGGTKKKGLVASTETRLHFTILIIKAEEIGK